ncbi:MAG: hypothetical protein QF886_23410, partial [Planctomycetota bacterium]|nr:hypothetical protein [Planctomycetota bacterium]
MPFTVNGIGTTYYGKSKVYTKEGVCDLCDNYGVLTSYDTNHFFTFVFIPVIPLGKKRVIDECPSCQRFRAMSLKEWEQLKKEGVEDSVREYLKTPTDEEAAANAVMIAVSFQDEDAFERLAEDIRAKQPGNAKLQSLLGYAFTEFSRHSEAETAYRGSLASEDDPDIRELLALNLLRQGRPEEAQPYLQHIIDQELSEQAPLLVILAEGFQDKGMHDEAVKILEESARLHPDVAEDKEFKKMHKASAIEHGSKDGGFLSDANFSSSEKFRPGKWLTVPLIIVVIFLGYLGVSYLIGANRTLYVVNGLNQTYDVSINGGERTRITGQSSKSVSVAEGEVHIKVLDEKLGIPDQ